MPLMLKSKPQYIWILFTLIRQIPTSGHLIAVQSPLSEPGDLLLPWLSLPSTSSRDVVLHDKPNMRNYEKRIQLSLGKPRVVEAPLGILISSTTCDMRPLTPAFTVPAGAKPDRVSQPRPSKGDSAGPMPLAIMKRLYVRRIQEYGNRSQTTRDGNRSVVIRSVKWPVLQ